MNKPRIFPKSLQWRGQFSTCVNKVYVNHQKTDPTLLKNVNGRDNSGVLYLPQYLHFLTPQIFREQKHSFLLFWLHFFAIELSTRCIVEINQL